MSLYEAVQLIENGQTEKGLELLKKSLKSANDEEKYEAALLFQSLGLIEDAKTIIEDLVYLYDDDDDLKIMYAEILLDLDLEDEALEILLAINEDSENRVQALLLMADLYQVQGLDEVAEQKLFEAKRILPNEPVVDFALGEYYFSKYDYKKAIPYYEKLSNLDIEVNGVNKDLRLAECLSAEGEWEDAITFYEKGIQHTKDFHTLLGYGITLFQAERYLACIPVFEEAIFFDPEYLVAHLWLSKAFDLEGQYQEGYEILQKALLVDETNVECLLSAAKLARKLKNLDTSKKHLQEALIYDPSLIEAVQLLVGILFEEEDFDEIIGTIDLAIEHGASDPHFNWDLGKAYYGIENYELALKQYRLAYNDFNQEISFLKEYGDLLFEEGLIQEAKEIYSKLVDDEYLQEEVQERLDRINEIL
ncbi:tetratricopeptide repeat protein [Gottfriedia luciferensis]|uniref:tetratricopeptide repeat protein n=1 Tax=Gottfriedia luciferensis TaxID=178774 RepID=UPI000B436D1F|nr:tetratricopeptide repeat protein [Gottfriedia luciferensis]